jgi:hypothetical protein
MTEEQLTELGQHYKRAVNYKTLCYQFAAEVAGHSLEVLSYGKAQAEELATMDDFTVGVLLMCDWGGNVPGELMARAHVTGTFTVPGSVEIQ